MSERAGQFRKGELVPGTNYRVEALIGSGGMGSVYRVEHAELGRRFVLKALHGHLASRSDLVARLKNEWRALGKLEHPNIVQVTDAGQTDRGLPYYVMENLRGTTLGQLLMARKRLNAREACLIVVDILAGLHAAHQTGAVHRDIKPPNIFIVEGGRAKLLDFGIAKLRDQSAKVVTAGGISIGTPRYMAPEQASGTLVDGRADIYATALVLYEMVVGKGPFSHIRDPNDLVMAHIGQEPERADFLEPRVPPELGDLLQRWLSKSPDSRPATAEFARRELSALAETFPTEEITANEEVTVGGAYEASTLGAGLNVTGGNVALNEKARTGSAASALGSALGSTLGSAVAPAASRTRDPVNEDIDKGPVATLSLNALEADKAAPEPLESGRPGTLGWGTGQVAGAEQASLKLTEKKEKRSESLRRGSPVRRVSVTPPPVSSPRPAALDASRTTLKWIAGTAAVSFFLAWGISRAMDRFEGEGPTESGAASIPELTAIPDGAARPEDSARKGGAQVKEPAKPDTGLGRQADAPADNSVPSGEHPVAPGGAMKGGLIPGDAAEAPLNSSKSGTVSAGPQAPSAPRVSGKQPASGSAAPPKQPSAPSKSQAPTSQAVPPTSIDDQLPDSGLW